MAAWHWAGYTPAMNERKTWRDMIRRCTNPKATQWDHYGGRGIRVCERWLLSFEDFFADMGPRPHATYTLDRKETDGHYEPDNCRWASKRQQTLNRRARAVYTLAGVTRPLHEWAKLAGTTSKTVGMRIARGLPLEVALRASRQKKGRRLRAPPA